MWVIVLLFLLLILSEVPEGLNRSKGATKNIKIILKSLLNCLFHQTATLQIFDFVFCFQSLFIWECRHFHGYTSLPMITSCGPFLNRLCAWSFTWYLLCVITSFSVSQWFCKSDSPEVHVTVQEKAPRLAYCPALLWGRAQGMTQLSLAPKPFLGIIPVGPVPGVDNFSTSPSNLCGSSWCTEDIVIPQKPNIWNELMSKTKPWGPLWLGMLKVCHLHAFNHLNQVKLR